jgi:hypothetical protein
MKRLVRAAALTAWLAAAACAGTIGGSGATGPCSDEVCDGFDNDCDGLVDEDCPCDDGARQDCYAASPASVGVGECRPGFQICAESSWGECMGQITPTEETCDGYDDDCDGQVDETCPCDDGALQPCYSGSPVTVGIGECSGGLQTCANETWGACADETVPREELCDGLDDDCDGLTDEDCPCDDGATQSCYTGPPATQGIGACKNGLQLCVGDTWGECGNEVLPEVENPCNGVDDDCDGLVDEDCPCTNGQTQPCYTGPANTRGVGLCSDGSQVCNTGVWGTCAGEVLPAPEQPCNGADDDCNGLVDESCPCFAGETQPCYTGQPQNTEGVGECHGGTQSCINNDWGPCAGEVTPEQEVCNGLDDDCDGYTDLDDEPANILCPVVSHGTPDCLNDTCVVASCDTGWVDVTPAYDCDCQVDPAPVSAGSACGSPISLGSLTDANADLVTVTGKAAPAGRTIWWSFSGVDDTDTAGDEYHVDVRFLTNPSTAYEMDVYRGGCAAGNRLVAGEKSSFDWYTDFNRTSNGCTVSAPCGEGDCASSPGPGQNSCTNDTATYYVGVRRTDGQASCAAFTVELSNGVH